jgi:hypothetical protein
MEAMTFPLAAQFDAWFVPSCQLPKLCPISCVTISAAHCQVPPGLSSSTFEER